MVVENFLTSTMQKSCGIFSMLTKNLLVLIFSGFIGAYINEFFRNYPVFSLRFKLSNKNLKAYNLYVDLFLVKGVAREVKWKVVCEAKEDYIKNFLELHYGGFNILKENESRFLFSIRSDDYEKYKLYENTNILIEFKVFKFITIKQSLKFDLSKYLSSDDITNNDELKKLIELTSSLRLEAEKEFKEKFNINDD